MPTIIFEDGIFETNNEQLAKALEGANPQPTPNTMSDNKQVSSFSLQDEGNYTAIIMNTQSDITFDINGNDVLKLFSNGEIFVHGKLIENDKQVVDGLRYFITQWQNQIQQVSSLDEAAENYAQENNFNGNPYSIIVDVYRETFKDGALSEAAKQYWFNQWQSQQKETKPTGGELISIEGLEKIGFEGNPHPKRRFKKVGETILTMYFQNDLLTLEDEDWFELEMPHIKYIHQVENLYRVLTGIEPLKSVSVPTGLRWVRCYDDIPSITKWYTIRNWITKKDAASIYCDNKNAILNYCKLNNLDFPEFEWLDESGETEETKPVEDKENPE